MTINRYSLQRNYCFPIRQNGAVLFFALIFLVIITMVALVATRGSTMQALAATNQQQALAALNAADSGLGAAITASNGTPEQATSAGHIIADSIAAQKGNFEKPYDTVAKPLTRCATSKGGIANCANQKLDDNTTQVTSAQVVTTYLGCQKTVPCPGFDPKAGVTCNAFRLDSTGVVADSSTSVSAIAVVIGACIE